MKKILAICSFFFAIQGLVDGVEHQSISTIGTIYPQYKSSLGSVVSGRVDEVFVDVGDSVKKGQEILNLDTSLYSIAVSEAEDAVESSVVEKIDAERNFDRMKKLFDKPEGQCPSISQKRFEDAKTRYEQAVVGEKKAGEALKRAVTNRNEATILAPYDGMITKRLVHPGDTINTAPVTKLMEIISIELLYVEFSIPQMQISNVHVGSPIVLDVEGSSCGKCSATIDVMYPDVDEKTRSIKCRTNLKNSDRKFFPGSLVRVCIPLKESASASL